MKAVDPGILPQSVCFSFTPPEMAKRLLFYHTWCGHYFCTENYFIRRDSFPPLLAMYVRKGVFRVEYRGEVRRARRGDVILLDCTEPHYYHAEDGLEFVYMHFDGANAHELCRHIMSAQGWLIQRDTNILVGKLILDMVEFYKRDGLEPPFDSSMRIYQLFHLLFSPTHQEREASEPIQDAIQYIRANVGKPLTLDELAKVAKLSPCYFSHCFKRQSGFSPMEYVINTRIDRAKTLLARTSRSVEEIAYEVGYASSGSFINQFVKRAGMSPSRYRRDGQEREEA